MSGIAGVRGGRVYGQHGPRHAPRGSDPSETDQWRNVGSTGTPWSSGTTYDVGDIVDDAGGIFKYQAASGMVNGVANLAIEPGVTSGWWSFWNYYASIFQNGSNRITGGLIPNPTPMRYRLSIGRPNDIEEGAILNYTHHQIDIEGDITSILAGETVFTILPEYQSDSDIAYRSHDSAGFYVPCRLLSTGEFIWGTP
jgi:hypothetical protein